MVNCLFKLSTAKELFCQDSQNDVDTKKSFIVDDGLEDDMGNDDGDESEEEPDLFDSVCAICDNGGEILWYACSFSSPLTPS